jgi:hypothetical protein
MADLSVFESTSWAKQTTEQRITALQALEDLMASKQGRQSRAVKTAALPTGVNGGYGPKTPDNLYINESLLVDDSVSFQLMNTVIHEGRHAYQDDCVAGKITPLPEDVEKVCSWSHNMPKHGGYYESGRRYIVYRYQPIEADANDYAKQMMSSFKRQYQHDQRYQQFQSQKEAIERRTELHARRDFGEDYKTEIAQIIEDKYKALAPRQQKLSDVARDSISIKPIQQKPLPKEPDASLHKEAKIVQAR